MKAAKEFSHYYKDVRHLEGIDVYRVLQLFEVTDPAIQHAVKKLLVAGGRGIKDTVKDLREAIVSIERAIEMLEEDRGEVAKSVFELYVLDDVYFKDKHLLASDCKCVTVNNYGIRLLHTPSGISVTSTDQYYLEGNIQKAIFELDTKVRGWKLVPPK